jgi:hypothetical protein
MFGTLLHRPHLSWIAVLVVMAVFLAWVASYVGQWECSFCPRSSSRAYRGEGLGAASITSRDGTVRLSWNRTYDVEAVPAAALGSSWHWQVWGLRSESTFQSDQATMRFAFRIVTVEADYSLLACAGSLLWLTIVLVMCVRRRARKRADWGKVPEAGTSGVRVPDGGDRARVPCGPLDGKKP